MNAMRRLWMIVAASALVVAPIATTGCSGGPPAPKTANVQAGDMPAGQSWKGVFFSELYGYLHLVQEGDTITGKWQRPNKDKWGELKGKATGDVVHFEWNEYVTGLVGPNAKKTGRGYFKFKPAAEANGEPSIVGEIGRDQDEVGEPWEAIRQKNIEPDLASIGGTGSSDVGGGDWDSENKEKGSAEPPASPPSK